MHLSTHIHLFASSAFDTVIHIYQAYFYICIILWMVVYVLWDLKTLLAETMCELA